MATKDSAAIAVAATGAYLVWALSPRLVGTPLPWDASWPYYTLAMGLVGFAVAQISSHGWACVVAAWAGQVAALVVLPLDRTANMFGVTAWWTLGVVATGLGALILGAGYALGRAVRFRKW